MRGSLVRQIDDPGVTGERAGLPLALSDFFFQRLNALVHGFGQGPCGPNVREERSEAHQKDQRQVFRVGHRNLLSADGWPT